MPTKRVSIFQVAQAAGVSHQTVSRVINQSPNVSEQTRARVLQVIDELGYRPSGAARALATRKSRTIALIAGGISYYGPLSTIASVESTARKHGLHVSISIMNEAEYTERDFTQVAHSSIDHGADAFVFVAPTDAMLLAALQVKVDVPRVILTSAKGNVDIKPWLEELSADTPTSQIAILGIDQQNAMEQIVAHLSQLGHRRLLYMAGPQEWRDAATRKSAWLDAIRASLSTDAPLQTQIIEVDDWSAQSAYEAMNLYIQMWQTSCTHHAVGAGYADYAGIAGNAGTFGNASSAGNAGSADHGADVASHSVGAADHGETDKPFMQDSRSMERRAEWQSEQSVVGVESVEAKEPPLWATAIVAANDLQAFGIRRALYEHGIRVPEDVSVVGFDDMPVADNAIPPLTTIRPNFSKLGVEAMATLLHMLGEGGASSSNTNADDANAGDVDAGEMSALDANTDNANTSGRSIRLFDAPLVIRQSTTAPASFVG
ncbi:hypothetical protein GCM10007377_10910 [Galliscardovia ingluviei]|uniref:HTH lacI-type domain-containing protein n=1 Tax=Galliscardovia ingluviei TaxID=1769422 RepID=A0A8J3AQ95_9BIFI|nr:hypothetical protein GCM10007377_10910 [Galliscardovia ingluviei]